MLTFCGENEKDMCVIQIMFSSAVVSLCGKGPLLNGLHIFYKGDFHKMIGE